MPKWWEVAKFAVKVGLKLGRVKEKDRIQEIVDGVDKVIKKAEKTKTKPVSSN